MKIAILSGKGGTGKTTIATNLAINVKGSVLIDTDVEEPNSHIFLKPKITETIDVKKSYPVVDSSKCVLCGACGDFCRYNSIMPAKSKVVVFKELCHGCGGCELVCPSKAIHYEQRVIGKIYTGVCENGLVIKYGDLNVGEVSGVNIIEKLKESTKDSKILFIDSPPGTSCATVAAVENSDYAIIVSEPTPFGVSDMKMVVEMLRNMSIKFGVVINKAGLGNDEIYKYCDSEGIEILGEIPFNKEIAKLYASGEILSYKIDSYKKTMLSILNKIIQPNII